MGITNYDVNLRIFTYIGSSNSHGLIVHVGIGGGRGGGGDDDKFLKILRICAVVITAVLHVQCQAVQEDKHIQPLSCST